MGWQAGLTLATAIGVLAMLAFTRISADRLLMLALGLLLVTGVLTPVQALAGFANPGVLTIALLYVVAAGLKETGAVYSLARLLFGRPSNPRCVQLRMIVPTSLLSAFMNNTGVVAMFIPAVQAWAKRLGVPASKLMLPLSYATILGGTCTLIGTSTNLVVDGMLQSQMGISLGLFDLAWVGVPLLLVGGGFLALFAQRLLPVRSDQSETPSEYSAADVPPPFDSSRAPRALSILALMVAVSATRILSILEAALLAAGLMIITGCVTIKGARRSLDFPVLMVIASSFALGTAMSETGAAAWLANGLLGTGVLNPWVALALVYLVTALFTEVITNNAAAVLMFPIALAVSQQLGVNFLPYAIAVMFAASASFITPFGYQTNFMVYGPGQYRFCDYIKIGVPMSILASVVTVGLIPLIWKF